MPELTPAQKRKAQQFVMQLPGKRGHDIPEDVHDTITSVGNGIARPMWGRDLDPFQIQALYDAGAHTPEQIHDMLGAMPHPHAPNVSVNDYPRYANAHKVWKDHR